MPRRRPAAGRDASSTTPNCVVVVYAMALAPRAVRPEDLDHHDAAGHLGPAIPGVARGTSRQLHPVHRRGEEEKIETETNKILGTLKNGVVEKHPLTISAAVTRVPVHNGHTGSISVSLEQRPDPEAIVAAWNSFRGKPQDLELPTAPVQPIVYLAEPNRPQPALDVNATAAWH